MFGCAPHCCLSASVHYCLVDAPGPRAGNSCVPGISSGYQASRTAWLCFFCGSCELAAVREKVRTNMFSPAHSHNNWLVVDRSAAFSGALLDAGAVHVTVAVGRVLSCCRNMVNAAHCTLDSTTMVSAGLSRWRIPATLGFNGVVWRETDDMVAVKYYVIAEVRLVHLIMYASHQISISYSTTSVLLSLCCYHASYVSGWEQLPFCEAHACCAWNYARDSFSGVVSASRGLSILASVPLCSFLFSHSSSFLAAHSSATAHLMTLHACTTLFSPGTSSSLLPSSALPLLPPSCVFSPFLSTFLLPSEEERMERYILLSC